MTVASKFETGKIILGMAKYKKMKHKLLDHPQHSPNLAGERDNTGDCSKIKIKTLLAFPIPGLLNLINKCPILNVL